MAKLAYQVVRSGAKKWMVWRLGEATKTDIGDLREYEEVARIVEDFGMWWVELPQWGVDGIEKWERQPRGWALKDGAIASVTKAPPPKALAS